MSSVSYIYICIYIYINLKPVEQTLYSATVPIKKRGSLEWSLEWHSLECLFSIYIYIKERERARERERYIHIYRKETLERVPVERPLERTTFL